MVSPDLWRDASAIASIFNDFGQISGLALNIPKTVVIPLWPLATEDVAQTLESRYADCTGVTVAEWGSYVGFAEVPGKGEHSWSKPLKKYRHRSALWGAQPLGL